MAAGFRAAQAAARPEEGLSRTTRAGLLGATWWWCRTGWLPPLGVELALHRPDVLAAAGLAVHHAPAALDRRAPAERQRLGCRAAQGADHGPILLRIAFFRRHPPSLARCLRHGTVVGVRKLSGSSMTAPKRCGTKGRSCRYGARTSPPSSGRPPRARCSPGTRCGRRGTCLVGEVRAPRVPRRVLRLEAHRVERWGSRVRAEPAEVAHRVTAVRTDEHMTLRYAECAGPHRIGTRAAEQHRRRPR